MFVFRLGSCAGVLLSLAVVTLSASAFAQATADEQKLIKRIPAGYVLYHDRYNDETLTAVGDLNGDGADDYALVVAKSGDDNFAGIMIFFKDGGDYKLALDNRACFNRDSDLENGMSAPSSISVEKGNLYFRYQEIYNCDRAVHTYTVRYRNSEFEVIGYDYVYVSCGRYGEGTIKKSVNFPARKQLDSQCEPKKKCNETWTVFTLKEPILLRKLSGIDFGSVISGYMVKKEP